MSKTRKFKWARASNLPFKIFPGMLIPGLIRPIDEEEDYEILHLHKHVFNSDVGVVIGSSIWWVYNPKDRMLMTHTKIAGLLCSCGSVLMIDEPKENKSVIYKTTR